MCSRAAIGAENCENGVVQEMRTDRIVSKAALLAGLALALSLASSSWAQSVPSSTPPANTPAAQPLLGATTDQEQTPATAPAPADDDSPSTPANPDELDNLDKPDKLIAPGNQKINVKPRSIDDVTSVGNREIGSRGLFNWYSTETEIRMGKMYAREIEKSTRLITDPVVNEYVNRIGQNIVRNSDCKVPFTIKVIDSDEINAFALPGGYFFVNSGLILNAGEEAELAGVMAHETAHVCAHHAVREMTRLSYEQIGAIPLIFIGGWTGYGVWQVANFAVPVTFLEYSHEFEAQADYLGVQYMYRAGYDPQAFITFFEKVQVLQKHKPGAVAKAFANHPQTTERIQRTQEEIARILPPREQYTVTTSEFDEVKARLARLENKRRLTDSTSGKNPGNPGSYDDKPTLHSRSQ